MHFAQKTLQLQVAFTSGGVGHFISMNGDVLNDLHLRTALNIPHHTSKTLPNSCYFLAVALCSLRGAGFVCEVDTRAIPV
jgi:hypothetical protein